MGVSFDEVDRRIIDQLRLDGRMPFTEIARKVNISEASVRSRYPVSYTHLTLPTN